MRTLLCLAMLLAAAAAHAQTYRWIDPATGRTMITDTPPPGSVKKVDRTKANGGESGPESFATRQAMEKYPVILYTSADCTTDCKNARDLLNKRGVPFSEKMVLKPEDFEELKALVGDAFIPTLKVGKQAFRGFQAESYQNLLDLAGYPTSAPIGSKPSGGLAK